MYKQTNEKFDFSTAELACIYIKKHKIWHDSCISLHPNVECCYLSSEDSIPVVEIKINEEYDLLREKGLNVKVLVGENGCGKSSLLDILSNGSLGGIAVLKDSEGNFVSNKKIKIKKNGSDIITLDKHKPYGFNSINDGFLPNVVAENNSRHRIKELPLAFEYCFLPIYQKNPKLYDFRKNEPIFTHFSIKPLPSLKEDFQDFFDTYILSSADIEGDDFEECFRASPLETIILCQMTSDKYWHAFNSEWFDGENQSDVYFADLIEYQGRHFFNDKKISEIINKYASQIKSLICDDEKYKEYELARDFTRVNVAWMGVINSLYNDLNDNIFEKPHLDLFYYGFKYEGDDKYGYDSFSSGEQQSLKWKYDIYPGLTQDLDKGRFWYVIDEPETSLHPEWSRRFWKDFIDTFNFMREYAISLNEKYVKYLENIGDKNLEEPPVFDDEEEGDYELRPVDDYKKNVEILKNRKFSIIVATHSPFILSDLFLHNIVCLEREKKDGIYRSVVKKNHWSTFAANIGEMFYEYFLDNTIGALAEEEIIKLVKYRQKNNLSEFERLSDDEKSPEQREYESIVKSIGDPVIRSLIEEVEVEEEPSEEESEEDV